MFFHKFGAFEKDNFTKHTQPFPDLITLLLLFIQVPPYARITGVDSIDPLGLFLWLRCDFLNIWRNEMGGKVKKCELAGKKTFTEVKDEGRGNIGCFLP